MANIEMIDLGRIWLKIQDPELQKTLSPYDTNEDTVLDERDAIDCNPEEAELCEANPAQRNSILFEKVMEKLGYSTASLETLIDTYIEVASTHQMVIDLKILPHEDNSWRFWNPVSRDMGFVEYEYEPDVWKNEVLPTIGGSTENYTTALARTATKYHNFARNFLDVVSPRYLNVGSEKGTIANYPIWTQVNVGKLPPPLQQTAIDMTMMMSEIMSWHWPEPGGPVAQIECEGRKCPKDDESQKLYLPPVGEDRIPVEPLLSANLCYVTGDQSNTTCYEGSFNPHIKFKGWCLGACFYAEDERSGDWSLGFYPVGSITEVFENYHL